IITRSIHRAQKVIPIIPCLMQSWHKTTIQKELREEFFKVLYRNFNLKFMIKKMDASVKTGKQRGGFGIEILYPGAAFSNPTDSGLAGIGRIDQARVNPGTLIPMHPHRNDEILTYIRTGRVKHTDSGGN